MAEEQPTYKMLYDF